MFRKFSLIVLPAIIISIFGLFFTTPLVPVAAFPQGALITVTTTADEFGTGAGCSLREALRAASTDWAFGGCPQGSGADTIQLAAGEYTISASQANSFYIQSDITIQGAGAANTIIDGNHLDIVLYLASGPIKLKQLAVRNAKGPGIYIQGPGMSVTLDEVDIYQNTAQTSVGGGIYNMGLLTINKSRIYGNTAVGGGGIWNNGSLTINNSMLSNNTASMGGGLYNQPGSGVKINGSTINGNRAASAANVVKDGGGIYNRGTVALINSTISGNMADGYGGGLYNEGGVVLRNVTITENIADNDENNSGTGGGVYNTYNFFLQNTILARNYNAESVGTSVDNCFGSQLDSEGYNLFGALNCSVGGVTIGNTTGNPLLTALGSYGGFTLVHALNSGSAAIDAGDPAGCKDGNGIFIFRDQRGALRPVDGDNNGSIRCDMGAFEFGSAAPINTPTKTPTKTPTTTPTTTPTSTATIPPTQTATNAPTMPPTQTATNAPTITPTQTSTLPSGCTTKPSKPGLTNPVGGAPVLTARARLQWTDAVCETRYRVRVRDAVTNLRVFKQNVGADVTQVKTTALPAGKTYKWFVRACNSFGCTRSAIQTFSRP